MSSTTPEVTASGSAISGRSANNASGGRGGNRQRGNRAGRTRGASGQQQGSSSNNRSVFTGNTDDMNGHVFQCFEEQSDRRQYAKTIKALDGYVKKNLTYSADMAPLFASKMEMPAINLPEDLEEGAGETMKMIFAEDVKRTRALASNAATVYTVIWGQCSEDMKARVKTHEGYTEKSTKNDCFWLLRQIKSVTLQFDESKNGFLSLLDARHSFLACKQLIGQSADEYAKCLLGWADTIETHGGNVAANYELIPAIDRAGNARSIEARKDIARERTLGIALIRSADASRYGTLITDLANQYAKGKDEYPTDVVAAKSLLVMYKTPTNAPTNRSGTASRSQPAASPEATAMTFAQRNALVAGTNGVTHDSIQCWTCQQHGHYAGDCPTGSRSGTMSGTTLTQYAFMLAQAADVSNNEHGIDPTWILLDSQSTISVFKNANMLTNIRRGEHVLRALTNGGHQDSSMVGDFPNLGEVWYNKASIANILSLAEVRKVCRVTMIRRPNPLCLFTDLMVL
ncbi:hypothetical protein MHU86_752 [Fragilaria crotonensis]|nr:hypothetical protein MHU86_752 [Fragilaria crotonensis]